MNNTQRKPLLFIYFVERAFGEPAKLMLLRLSWRRTRRTTSGSQPQLTLVMPGIEACVIAIEDGSQLGAQRVYLYLKL